MNSAGAPNLDPAAISSRSFPKSSFRGYDTHEVDEYLASLASALREREEADDDDGRSADKLEAEIEKLRAENDTLEVRIHSLETRLADAESQESAPMDEAAALQLLGHETTRVLETARSSAFEIVAKAEADVASRTAEIDRVQTLANTEVADQRRTAEDEAAAVRAEADADATALRESVAEETETLLTEAREEAETLRRTAGEEADDVHRKAEAAAAALTESSEAEAAAVRDKATDAAAASRVKAEAQRIEILQVAETAKAQADTDAARIRAEAEADVLASQEGAKETTRQMVVEAQAVREKVLSDLVKRRRLGRQQLDQAKAARDRLYRSIVEVRTQLEASAAELEIALPEAKKAMDAIARQAREADDFKQIRDLEIELDTARVAGVPIGNSVLLSEGPAEPVVATGSAALGSLDVSAKSASSSEEGAVDTEDGGTEDESSVEGQADENGNIDGIFARLRDDPDGPEEGPDNEGESADGAATEAQADDGSADDAVADSGDAGSDEEDSDDEDDEDADDEIEVPAPFVQRDVALTRHGAELRRRLKRTMADDQSELLDQLRRARKMSTDDLTPADEQRAAYVDAVTPALRAAAGAGAELHDGKAGKAVVDELIERVVASVLDPLRHRVEKSVENASGDSDEVLDPIRAHYRDLRLTEIPAITDDALAEAFALGAYHALSDGTVVRWVADPRFEPNPDCFDNTLAEGVVKPEPFPTGRAYPQGEPGCRCLVIRVS